MVRTSLQWYPPSVQPGEDQDFTFATIATNEMIGMNKLTVSA